MGGKILGRFRLVYRRSSNLVKCVVLVTIVLCMVTLVTLGIVTAREKDRTEALRKQAALLEQENQELRDKIDWLGTAQGMIRYAFEELGLVDPDTIVFEPVETTEPE